MKIPFGLILALVATQFLSIPFGVCLIIVFVIEATIFLKKAINAPDAIQPLDPKSPEYLARFMPKN